MNSLLLTRKEAAAFCGFKKPEVLDNLIRKGIGPARVMMGVRVYFKRHDLQVWIDANRSEPPKGS